MPSPAHYPDGTARSPRYSDDDEMIEPAYFRAVRSRSQSRCGTPAQENGDEAKDTARQAAGGNERRASSVWNASLPKPQLFSNIFFQDQLPSSSGSAQQGTPPNASSGLSPPKKTRNGASYHVLYLFDSPVEKTEAVRAHPTPPEPAPPPPPPETSPIETDQPPPPPLPPPEEPVAVPPSNDYYKTNVIGDTKFVSVNCAEIIRLHPSMLLPPPPPPPAPSSLGVRLSVPSQPATKPAPPPPTAPSTSSGVDRGLDFCRKSSAPTVRSTNKKSRQDGLLEENPSPPRSPRRRLSRSPGPRAPLCPSQRRETGSKTPAHESQPHASGSRTPGYRYDSNNVCNGARTPAHGSATPYHSVQTPRYCGGSPEYKGGARTPGYGGRTPNQGSYGARTPGCGGWTPGNGPNTPFYMPENNYGARTPNQGSQTPYYEPQSSGYGARSPGPRGPSRGPSTPFYTRDSPERGPHTPRDGARTPLFDGRSSTSHTAENPSLPGSAKSSGFNKAYAGHTPMRPPASYPDGTPRSPRYEDNEEEAMQVFFFLRLFSPTFLISSVNTSSCMTFHILNFWVFSPACGSCGLMFLYSSPSYMRSPKYTGSSNEEPQPVQPTNVPDSDPLSIHNRVRTPPPPERTAFQQNTPPAFPNASPMNGFGVMGQPGMPSFSPAPPQNPFMPPPPFGHPPFMFPNQFGMFPPPGMPPIGVPPPAGVPPPFFPGLHVPPSPFAPPQPLFASTPKPPTSSSNVPQQSNSPPKSDMPSTSTASGEPRPPTTTTSSKKCAPPQRAGGSVYLETPPPAPKPSAPTSKPRKEPKKRKRRRSYDRSDSD
ncbi:hypothetical protein ANCCAN_06839 [Ancylostoma caninum]|uniref:Uncharacterized protein n=1 Tax=Ancylostoma caninum TaxID=29170 RepID=A0A368GVT9_ANCCA|nr:hypothetical protein ANCCAN_06839 [Ancylostoma caninum]